ncbi:MAG TPA: glucuronate isomerase [Candidatus Angelobacter sp.]|nr:glucuronate isomerase [Candidatus Angelobacter sp.]
MGFITEHFLLQSETARYLYKKYAAAQPILDYHCHLSPKDLAENRRFGNLFEIWLEGDHYKWRAMRANGVPERFCTGDVEPYQKFLAWAETVPHTLRNPLYHWVHLELKRYFGIERLLDRDSAAAIWQAANARLMDDDLSARGILERFHVTALCTTDDPTDSLEYHQQLSESGCGTRVFPAFRPDRALRTRDPISFNRWLDKLSAGANIEIARLADFLAALENRHDCFHQHGCRLSDHGLDYCHTESCSEAEASAAFVKVRSGYALSSEEADRFSSYLMIFFGHLDAAKGWTKQLHLGAYRNANGRMLNGYGRDAGFDSIGDWPQVALLGKYLDSLDRAGALPRTIIYNANPGDNYAFATMIGNFQDGNIAGKIQLGSAWWFLDQKDAMEQQLNALSNCGLLSRFVGMVTDSRSFMSYPRHEYFRRVLCNLIGSDVERGELPDDEELVGGMIKRICYHNAADYLCLPMAHKAAEVSAAVAANGHGLPARGVEAPRIEQMEKGS